MLLSRHICSFANEAGGRHGGLVAVRGGDEAAAACRQVCGELQVLLPGPALETSHVLAVIDALSLLVFPERSLLGRLQH